MPTRNDIDARGASKVPAPDNAAMEYPPIAPHRVESLLAPLGERSAEVPAWYLRRWHFHPDGYLSRSGVRWYDRVVRHLYNWPSESSVQSYVAQLVVRLGTTRVVDAGCGSGHQLGALTRRVPALQLYGVDLSPVMLARARAVVPAEAGVVFRHADFAALQPADFGDAIDLVVMSHVLGHAPGEVADRLAEQATEIVRPGGYVVVVDHAWHPVPPALGTMRLIKTRRFRGRAIQVRVYRQMASGLAS